LFLIDGEEIVGEVYLRFALTPVLEKDGGNIGYQIRPRARNRGYATVGLRLALKRLKDVGLSEALLTCSDANAASIRVIEKVGGFRIDDAQLDDGTLNRRYTIQTGSAPRHRKAGEIAQHGAELLTKRSPTMLRRTASTTVENPG
jgi:predicted acetyltransferase